MTTASASQHPKMQSSDKPDDPNEHFDPDSFRMTVGEHLEELRGRLILGLGGLIVAVLACLLFSERVMIFFCQPLTQKLEANSISPQVFYSNLTDPFMTYLKVTMITAAAIAGPWMIYQAWCFVAAGLYPNERKTVTRYIPLSVTLFVAGLVFVYMIVLPLSIDFFIRFSSGLWATPTTGNTGQVVLDEEKSVTIPSIHGDVKDPQPGQIWFNEDQNKLKIVIASAADKTNPIHIRSLTFNSESMMTPIITIGDYIDLVFTFMLTFGIAFQLPLVMLAVVSIGIVDRQYLQKNRRIMFFGMAVGAAFFAPGDIIYSMLALLIPLVVLYEFGLILVRFSEKRKAAETVE